MKTLETRKRGQLLNFIPLAIGTAISLIVVVSVMLPIINGTIYNATGVNPWTGTTKTILDNVLPLAALIALVVIAAAIISVFGRQG